MTISLISWPEQTQQDCGSLRQSWWFMQYLSLVYWKKGSLCLIHKSINTWINHCCIQAFVALPSYNPVLQVVSFYMSLHMGHCKCSLFTVCSGQASWPAGFHMPSVLNSPQSQTLPRFLWFDPHWVKPCRKCSRSRYSEVLWINSLWYYLAWKWWTSRGESHVDKGRVVQVGDREHTILA